jgi:phosphate starvation-inducible membrane PsiE
MIDNLEFSDTKQIRKTILITSFAGICFKMLVKNSTGNIEFIGFKIPVSEAHIIPNLVGYVIIFEIIALIIRYNDEDAREKYKKYLKFIEERNISEIRIQRENENVPQKLRPNYKKAEIINKSVFFLDIIFPIILGIGALIKIFNII